MIEWPPDLVMAIARRRAVPFLGAGISMHSQTPAGARPLSWQQFLARGIEACAHGKREMQGFLNRGDWLTCCQLIKYRMGGNWTQFVEAQFANPAFQPAQVHENIFRLDASIIVTTNFDRIYERYVAAKTVNRFVVKKYDDDDIGRFLRGNEEQRLLIKAHGDIDHPGHLIFTREDYANIRAKHGNFYGALNALILTNTFLFMGCGMSDPDLCLLLEEYARGFSDSQPHYFVTSARISAEYKRMIESNYNLIPIRYSDANNHQELVDSIGDLANQIDNMRDDLANRGAW